MSDRSDHIERLLEDPLMVECFESIKRQIIEAIEKTDIAQDDYQKTSKYRDSLFLSLKMLARVKGWFEIQMQYGQIEPLELSRRTRENRRGL